MQYDVRVLVLTDGRCPVETWYRSLRDAGARIRVAARVARLRAGNLGDTKSVGGGVHELRIDAGPGYRIYYGVRATEIVVLVAGGDKSTQARDIAYAKRLWEESGDGDEGLARCDW